MAETMLSDRLNRIIAELGIPKSEFARSVGITRDYIYLLTGRTGRVKSLSRSVAMLIEQKYGYRAEWILTGAPPVKNLAGELSKKMKELDEDALRKIEAQIDALKGGAE
jgi:predicted transcriptional regulator